MTGPEDELRRYLTLPTSFAMGWEARCEAIAWRSSGRTVAFRAEIAAAVESLARDGLVPSFEAMLSAFALIRELTPEEGGARLRGLDPSIWTIPLAAAHVVAHILERAGAPQDRARADRLLAGLEAGLPREGLMRRGEPDEGIALLESARTFVAGGVSRADPDEILRRIRTSVTEQVEAAPVQLDLDDAARVSRLLRELESDDEYRALARLARDLMAALRLPRPTSVEQDLPIGGYADIANRGEIDRLLLSELAQDDDVLASRIVLGEALFLRREVPRDTPRRDLTIVIDAGIRTWGTARVFATAAALAVSARIDRGAQLDVVRANGATLEPVDLTSRDGLLEHMGQLTADPHPGEALRGLSASEPPPGGAPKRVLITTQASFADSGLRAALAAEPDWSVVAVDAGGSIELFELTSRGVRLASSASVSLDDIQSDGDGGRRMSLRAKDSELPAYLDVLPSPLLIGHNLDRVWSVDHPLGTLIVTARHRVMFWGNARQQLVQRQRRGALELGVIPGGDLVAFGALPNGAIVATHDRRNGLLRTLRLSFHEQPFEEAHPVSVRRFDPMDDLLHGLHDARREFFIGGEKGRELSFELMKHSLPPRGPVEGSRTPQVVGVKLLRRIRAIGVESAPDRSWARLVLVTQRAWMLDAAPGFGVRLRLMHSTPDVTLHPLDRVQADHPEARFLRMHRWRDDSIAWMDRRGLLHLRSGNRAEGELTLTLDIEQAIAAWCSRGWTLDPADEADEADPSQDLEEMLFSWLHRFAARVAETEVGS